MANNNYALELVSNLQEWIDIPVSAASIRNQGSFTWEAWVKPGSNSNTSQYLWAERQSWNDTDTTRQYSGHRFAVVCTQSEVQFLLARADNTTPTKFRYEYNLGDDRWHHIAFAARVTDTNPANQTYSIFIDGAEMISGPLNYQGHPTLTIGQYYDGDNNIQPGMVPKYVRVAFNQSGAATNAVTFWDGKVDSVRLWATKLSQQAIAVARLNFLLSPQTEADLIEEWRFEPLNDNPGATQSRGMKNTTAYAQLKQGTNNSSALWVTDRPFMGDIGPDITAPSAPSNLTTADITETTMRVSWTGSTDNVYVQGYEVVISTTSNFQSPVTGYSPLNVPSGTTTATITGLLPGTNYYWRVRALDSANNYSAWVNSGGTTPVSVLTKSAGDTQAPTVPVAASASSVQQTSFTANWGASTDNVGVATYILDVATDTDFVNYVPMWQARIVNNVTTFVVTGLNEQTTYYYRVRARDAAFNESLSSNVISVQTAAAPDITPPNPVSTKKPTSIEDDTFVANWDAAVDNIAVTGYIIDVATSSQFTTFVAGYQNLNVGNTLSYPITGLKADTSYFYRVRAYDAAANISRDSGMYEEVKTSPVLAGTNVPYDLTVGPSLNLEVREATPTTSYTDLSAGGTVVGTASGRRRVLMRFIRGSSVIGTIQNLVLNLYVTNKTTATVRLGVVTDNSWSETTTWNTRPTPTSFISFTTPAVNGIVSVDITGLIPSSSTSFSIMLYLDDGQTDDLVISGIGSATAPTLTMTIDPQSAFQFDAVRITSSADTRYNLLSNPSAEVNLNSIAINNSTDVLSRITTTSYVGTACASITPAVGTNNSAGIRYRSATNLGWTGTTRYVSGSIYVRRPDASASAAFNQIYLRVTYTDGTQTTGTFGTATITSQWQRIFVPTVATTSTKTVNYIDLLVTQLNGTGATIYCDAALIEEVPTLTSVCGSYFDGATPFGGAWSGTTHDSISRFSSAKLSINNTYVGDNNSNSSISALWFRDLDAPSNETISFLPQVTLNRTAKTVVAEMNTRSLSQVVNLIDNPSFESGITGWTSVGASTLTQSTVEAFTGASSLRVTGANTTGTLFNGSRIFVSSGTMIYLQARVKAIAGSTVEMRLTSYTSADVAITNGTQTVTCDGSWKQVTLTYTAPANTFYVVPQWTKTNTTGTEFYIDAVQLTTGATYPYFDGDLIGARWVKGYGPSPSYLALEFERDYQIATTVSDVDGVFGDNPYLTTVTTPAEPMTTLFTSSIETTPDSNSLDVVVSYQGDDAAASVATIEYKRGDQSAWVRAVPSYDRVNKKVLTTITNLSPVTEYQVRASFSGVTVYGVNPLTEQVVTTAGIYEATVRPFISFGGFVLQGPDEHPYWVSSHDSFSHPSRRMQIENLPRLDGGVEIQSLWGTRTITMRGGVSGESRSELAANIAALRKALAVSKQRLVIDTLSDTNRYFIASCTSFGISETGGQNYRHVLWDAEFIAADPFRYDAGEISEQTITMGDGSTLVVTNSGDLYAEPIITVTTSSLSDVSVTIINESTGERILPIDSTTISRGDVLVADTTKLRLTKNNYEVDYAGSFPRLVPGDNRFKIRLTPTTETIQFTLRRRERYL